MQYTKWCSTGFSFRTVFRTVVICNIYLMMLIRLLIVSYSNLLTILKFLIKLIQLRKLKI